MSDENSRQQWNSKIGFILSAVGSAVGLGNIWRFPYVLYENGGGGFLIPYFIAIFTAAIPLLILEYTLGSKYRGSAPMVFAKINRKYEWVGWLPTFISFFIILYYSSIISWALNYLLLSINKGWGASPSDFYFQEFLKISSGPFNFGGMNFNILIGLGVLWGLTYIISSTSISNGIEKLNKILLPALAISVLIVIIRGVTLDGAMNGLNVLFTPDFSKLLEPKIWIAAYSQVFFSLSVAMGVMITYSSYLPKNSDVVNTAYITGLANSAFELTISIGIFSILGYMAKQNGVPVTEVVAGGVGLAFIVFPTAFNLMAGLGNFLGIVFFATLVFAGITSFVSLTEAFITPFIDKFYIERKKVYKMVCGGGFLLSSIYATGAGLHILDIVDNFINIFGIVGIGIVEAVVVGYVFKLDSFKKYANEHSFQKVGKVWTYSILLVVPIFLGLNLIYSAIDTIRNGYGGYSLLELGFFGFGTILLIIILSGIMSNMRWYNESDLELEEE